MFEKFLAKYQAEPRRSPGAAPVVGGRGAAELFSQYSGATFGSGVYRLHTAESAAQANDWIRRKWLDFSQRIDCFAVDWMGRQFSLDPARREGGEPLVLLYEPATGEALEIPATFEGFHDDILVNMAEEALFVSLFEEWKRANPGRIPLGFDRCVGYRVPMFLGGEENHANLDESDLDVYWEITIQLVEKIRGQ